MRTLKFYSLGNFQERWVKKKKMVPSLPCAFVHSLFSQDSAKEKDISSLIIWIERLLVAIGDFGGGSDKK